MNSPVRMLAIRQKTLIWFDDVKSDCDRWWLRRAVSEIVLTREASRWILLFRQCGASIVIWPRRAGENRLFECGRLNSPQLAWLTD